MYPFVYPMIWEGSSPVIRHEHNCPICEYPSTLNLFVRIYTSTFEKQLLLSDRNSNIKLWHVKIVLHYFSESCFATHINIILAGFLSKINVYLTIFCGLLWNVSYPKLILYEFQSRSYFACFYRIQSTQHKVNWFWNLDETKKKKYLMCIYDLYIILIK